MPMLAANVYSLSQNCARRAKGVQLWQVQILYGGETWGEIHDIASLGAVQYKDLFVGTFLATHHHCLSAHTS